MPGSKRAKTAYWMFTILFCLMMGFTVYAQLRLPQVAQVFSRLGFPELFSDRAVLSQAGGPAGPDPAHGPAAPEGVGLCRLHDRPGLGPHRPSLGRGRPEPWSWSVGYFVLGALSYFSFRMTAPS
jgi:hypothetical protein